jgi:hypothetical protein
VGGFFTRTLRWRGLIDLKKISCWTLDVGSVVGGWMESSVAIEAGLVLRLEANLVVGFANGTDIGRGVGNLLNLLVGLDSLEPLDFPNPKSLAKNPCFSTFCSTGNVLHVMAAAGEIFTEERWVGPLSNKDEGRGVCSDRREPGTFILDVDVKVAENGSGPNNGGSRVWLLRAGLLLEAMRMPPGLPSRWPSIRVFDQSEPSRKRAIRTH